MLLKRLNKSKSLRIVNLLGLTTMFCCLALSYAFIKKELSYDRFHENADRIMRFSVQWNNEPIDGRNWGFSKDHPFISGIAGIEDMVLMDKINTGVITHNTTPRIINDFYFAGSNFFNVFSFPLLEGEKNTVLDAPEKAVISKSLAEQLFGTDSPIGKEINLSGRRLTAGDKTVFISGVFEDFPEASHFHTDLILHRPDSENRSWAYIYLLTDKGADLRHIEQAIAGKMEEQNANSQYKASPFLMPLTDIHLHSHLLRELEINGSITYVYLIASANVLLLLIVMFNLWLNTGLIFSFNRKYYQLLRLNGASSTTVIRDESLMAAFLGIFAIILGAVICIFLLPKLNMSADMSIFEIGGLCLAFLALVLFVSLLPVMTGMSSTLFKYNQEETKPGNFTLSKVKYLLMAQYCIVMLVVIIGFGINKQMKLIESSQVGGGENTILVMDEQPDVIKNRFEVLKNELLKYPEIEAVTSAMQLPGSAIRDGLQVQVEGESEDQFHNISVLVVGDDFLPFFGITPIAGSIMKNNPLSYHSEKMLLDNYFADNTISDVTEEYIINRSALKELGFASPEEAISKIVKLNHEGGLEYINKGKIVGVTEDYNYTTTFEASQPQILLQRKSFQHCIMARLSASDTEHAIAIFNEVWNKINPDYPAGYTFLRDVYAKVYHNEVKAKSLARIFSILCLIIANLGLFIITSFVVKRKTKEIGVRKVNGATPFDIVRMLNNRFVLWIGISFFIALPCAWLIMNNWLKQFALKVEIDGWIYTFAGLLVLSLSMISISWQSWKAATINPIHALKSE